MNTDTDAPQQPPAAAPNPETRSGDTDKYLRLYAEFENFKKRTSKERSQLVASASARIMTQLLPVVDDLQRALANQKDDAQGWQLIYDKLVQALTQEGLKPLEIKPGDTFDPTNQEAITQIEAPSPELKGKVVEVIAQGYCLGDRVIRFAQVITGM